MEIQYAAKATCLALSGGVGGAKLALGLARVIEAEQLTIVANTADDFVHLGLPISPDLDTVMYTLAGVSNQQQGWGLEDEGWQMMSALNQLGGESWFQLGDRDLATHLQRAELLRQGYSLSEITTSLCRALGVQQRLLPMTNQSVATHVKTAEDELPFQHYFVREQCRPEVSGFRFAGIEQAEPLQEWLELLGDPSLQAVVICPSNPFVSVEPILAMRGVREALESCQAPIIAVSPIVSGMAIKGPAAKMMAELNMPVTALGVAEYYGDLLDGFVIDESDAESAEVMPAGVEILVTATVMKTLEDRETLARNVLQFAHQLRGA